MFTRSKFGLSALKSPLRNLLGITTAVMMAGMASSAVATNPQSPSLSRKTLGSSADYTQADAPIEGFCLAACLLAFGGIIALAAYDSFYRNPQDRVPVGLDTQYNEDIKTRKAGIEKKANEPTETQAMLNPNASNKADVIEVITKRTSRPLSGPSELTIGTKPL